MQPLSRVRDVVALCLKLTLIPYEPTWGRLGGGVEGGYSYMKVVYMKVVYMYRPEIKNGGLREQPLTEKGDF